ncbi:uncharacterized protein LOC122366616 [Amphibalanus amphitrite]|uniref:uncharacterized protein LOC122366616 n=1 Tax=Amphibalanus amphitrite TaxID=1232801 RepID=UPI001C923519|nr:uncharacterized protein LOC122366616 [Amphibalanus amphitrite]XP_043195005.1 uncharacterized protein LOC122366616 [Amphibalanus amphitrite]XP_043195006.1 uncharacterized protein LOC122366616 [Amphibalanus amphitrite]XP_043195007.1 uncharacterized protein LOC122366616 [Amphibalanus amphitrite]
MNNMDQLTEQYKEKFPHLKSYTECVSRTFISGLAATFITFSGTYMAVSLLKNKLPSSRPGHLNVVAAGLLGTLVGFQVVYTRTKACNNGWLAAEDRATYLRPLAESGAADSSTTHAD